MNPSDIEERVYARSRELFRRDAFPTSAWSKKIDMQLAANPGLLAAQEASMSNEPGTPADRPVEWRFAVRGKMTDVRSFTSQTFFGARHQAAASFGCEIGDLIRVVRAVT